MIVSEPTIHPTRAWSADQAAIFLDKAADTACLLPGSSSAMAMGSSVHRSIRCSVIRAASRNGSLSDLPI